MEYIIENEKLKITLSSKGAEITSVIDKNTGNELAWTGDEKFWSGHGPILFPACGGLWNGEYTLDVTNPQGDSADEKTFKMPKHGVVRRMEWELEDKDDDDEGCTWVVLRASTNDETKSSYPFDFSLLISYELNDTELTCSYVVANYEERRAMPFQIGGHPSFMLPDYSQSSESTEPIGYLQPVSHQGADVDAHCLSIVRVGEQGCWRPERYPAPCTDEGLIPICVDTFAHEALIFDRNQVSGFRILNKQKRRLASVRSDAPVFLIWQPKDLLSPFVCVEPWYGLCDQEGHSTSLIERPYSQCVMPEDERWGRLYSITYNL